MTTENIKKDGNNRNLLPKALHNLGKRSLKVSNTEFLLLNSNWRLTQLMTVLEDYQGHGLKRKSSVKTNLVKDYSKENIFKNNYKNEVLYKNTIITNPLIPVMSQAPDLIQQAYPSGSLDAPKTDSLNWKSPVAEGIDSSLLASVNVRFPINANFVAQWLSENIVSSKNYKLSILCDRVIKASKLLTGNYQASELSYDKTTNFNLVGIKIIISGRILGAEIATSKTFKAGQIPSNTIDILKQTGFALAKTRSGTIGIKVIYFWKGIKV